MNNIKKVMKNNILQIRKRLSPILNFDKILFCSTVGMVAYVTNRQVHDSLLIVFSRMANHRFSSSEELERIKTLSGRHLFLARTMV